MPVDISLTNKIKIRTDDLNWIISVPCNLKKHKEQGVALVWRDKWFYNSFAHLVDDLLEMEIRASDAKTLKDITYAIERAKNAVIALYKP